MNREQILEELHRENANVEFKRDLRDRQDIAATIGRFANGQGGTLLVGAHRHSPHIVGVDPAKTRRLLQRALKLLAPVPHFKWLEVKLNGETIVVLEVPKSESMVAHPIIEETPHDGEALTTAIAFTLPAWVVGAGLWAIRTSPPALQDIPIPLGMIMAAGIGLMLMFLHINWALRAGPHVGHRGGRGRVSSHVKVIVLAIDLATVAVLMAGMRVALNTSPPLR